MAVKISGSETISKHEAGFKLMLEKMHRYFEMSQAISGRQPVKVTHNLTI